MNEILEAFRVLSRSAFSCAGHVVETRGDSLQKELTESLYRLCYSHRFIGTYYRPAQQPLDRALVQELQAANSSRTIHDQGWKIEQTHPSGKILASRNGITRWFLPGHYLADKGPGFHAKEECLAVIQMQRESTTEQAGFYMAFGETVSHDEENRDILRLYWNISANGAPRLMSGLTRELNRFQIPFMFKCGNRTEMYGRSDAAVLYVNRRYYAFLTRLLGRLYPEIADTLSPDIPLFTQRLADGLALAEDTPDGKSFGMNRCDIVAAALIACHERGLESADERLAELHAQFRSRGLDPERPYLGPGSRRVYDFPFLA